MAGHGGGAWKVAYADFVTAMMAFFMVMWIVAQGKPVKEAIAQYFQDPTGHSGPREGASSTTPSDKTGIAPPSDENLPQGSPIGIPGEVGFGSKKSKGKGKGDGTKKQIVSRPREGELMVGTSVVFAEHSADLSEAAKEQLLKVVPSLVGKRNKIELRSHSTRRPLPSGSPFRDAWQLCYARAAAVMKFLEEQGVEAERFRLSEAGPYEPAYTLGIDPVKQAANSRVEIYQLAVFVDDLAGGKPQRDARPGAEPKH